MNIPTSALEYVKIQYGGAKGNDLATEYREYCAGKTESITPFLPPVVKNIVNIGGGMSGIAISLLTENPNAILHIVDGDEEHGVAEKKCGDKPYNSFAATKEFFLANKITEDRVQFHSLSVDDIPPRVDVVVSFAAWGFHFPLETYLPIVGKIKRGGLMVIDLRIQKNEIEKLAPYFSILEQKEISHKMMRYFLKRNNAAF